MAFATERAARDEPIDHGSQLGVAEAHRLAAAMPARAGGIGGAEVGDQSVDPHVRPQRLATMKASEGVEQAALGQLALGRIDRSVSHGRRWRQPSVGVGRGPSTAIWIAWASSSERVCFDSPPSIGLAKTRVWPRPCRLLITIPSRRSSSSAMAKL